MTLTVNADVRGARVLPNTDRGGYDVIYRGSLYWVRSVTLAEKLIEALS